MVRVRVRVTYLRQMCFQNVLSMWLALQILEKTPAMLIMSLRRIFSTGKTAELSTWCATNKTRCSLNRSIRWGSKSEHDWGTAKHSRGAEGLFFLMDDLCFLNNLPKPIHVKPRTT